MRYIPTTRSIVYWVSFFYIIYFFNYYYYTYPTFAPSRLLLLFIIYYIVYSHAVAIYIISITAGQWTQYYNMILCACIINSRHGHRMCSKIDFSPSPIPNTYSFVFHPLCNIILYYALSLRFRVIRKIARTHICLYLHIRHTYIYTRFEHNNTRYLP